MKETNRGSILAIQDGNLIKRIDRAVSEVMENINDFSYPHDKPRKIVITLEFKADSERKRISMKADIKKTLPAKATLTTDLFNYKVKDRSGNTVSMLEEKTDAPIGQIDLNGNEIKPTLVAYKVDETSPVIGHETAVAEIVRPLPQIDEEFEQDDVEKFKGTKIVF